MKKQSYHQFLEERFEQKKLLNPSYSLRAYARDLGMSPSKLSQILNRKQGLSQKYAETLCDKLNIVGEEKKWFCHSVGALHSRSKKERQFYSEKLSSTLI